jgi:hypothetical protein
MVAEAIPEILSKYPSGAEVSLSGKFMGQQSDNVAKFTADGQSLQLYLLASLSVGGEVALEGEFDAIQLAGKLYGANGSLFGNIGTAKIGTVAPDSFKTTLDLTADQLATKLTNLVDTNIATLNSDLAAGVPVPTIAGINISDFEISFFDGYTAFGLNVSPAFWQQVSDSFSAWKEARKNQVMAYLY